MALAWVLQHKLVLLLSVALTAFTVSTIFLAVQKTDVDRQLRSCSIENEEITEQCATSSTFTSSSTEQTNTEVTTTTTMTSPSPTFTSSSTEQTTTEVTTTTPMTSPSPTITSSSTEQTTTEVTTTTPGEDESYRLPSIVVPIHYDLQLVPNIFSGSFSGTNRINVNVTGITETILLHSNGLAIESVTVADFDGTSILSNFKLIPERELLKITLDRTVPRPELNYDDDILITIAFSGSMLNRIVGLYSSSYLNPQLQPRYMATSKFEPTYARQAFPCFDEPSMKAKYKISLVHPTGDGYHALSNMPVESSIDNGNGTTTVHFQESVRMSSYLACFIVSDFAFKQEQVNDNLLMRVFATPAQLNKVDFALDTGVKITRFYIDYFKVDYPLPKLDMAAIPDFVSGAMEHWGLVTFRETALLYDRTISSTVNRQRVATVIAHEIAHSWFGNLVTMAWWDELWLNEGFASYIEYKGTQFAYPEWKMIEQFLIEDLHSVLTLDATLASHPIVQIAETPDQITELFDSITYSKGASVIRMLEHFVGEENFRQSVTSYLINHQFDNAVTLDLLTEIDNLNLGFDVKDIMATWTRQMGFPVVNVVKRSDTQYRLTQTRFFSNPENAQHVYTDSPYNYRWHIPITYQTDTTSTVLQWFSNEDVALVIDVPAAHHWIKFNKDQVGYYRVNYPRDMWTSFTNVLKNNVDTFSISDRGHLMNDAFSLAEATLLDYDIALDLTSYLTNELEYVPWSVASTNILGLKNHLYYTQQFSKFSKFGQSVIQKVYESVGWSVDDDHLKNQLRTTVLNFACSIGLQSCINDAGNQFNAWLLNPNVRPNPDLRNIVYYYGMASVGNEEKWDQVWQIYMNETDAQEKAKLVYGLSGIQLPWMLKRFIDLAWDERNVRGQDYFTCIQNIAANRIGEAIVWDYVRDNWQNMVTRFGLNERYLGRMIPSICGRFNTNIKLEEVKQFFAKYPEAGAGAAARQQTIQNIQNNIKWLENNEQKVAHWLNAKF